ncbi:methylmalonyl-CoA mutase [Meiothermus ruber]|uniref:Methylmalonyl-CoA mutase large subunit n=1 Tax=Meiothermus ruber (strain ATCC 35948 / DSM 1279 / VKM B-1258 / 21) TaxID=504728 RepID=D3PP56_MEIRD|nr:methylmalonyl-CoA mutase family protein [Meiothermus ruber]ADD27465.1 methylmalonyl-CoA mutase, large subunit [Meiothermus ruber DSM 1279]AGK03930.1 methylmalonyl-CoA mutase large subunit [Meiothermus ruber DSM 1279]MCL6530487.1 methylmalonyl-CoA mutase family protein [Meiothermus ruber]GAO74392.1 methylmalonyl-CoA mutase large subunit [Meiothermus ruber H328]
MAQPRPKHAWMRETYQKSLAKMPERKVAHKTLSDIAPEPLYTPEDLQDFDYAEKLGYPGEYPYTRGVYGSMYRSRLWTMRMFAGFGTAEQTNERFKKLLAAGQNGLSTAFDLPTLMGYDSDHPLSKGEVGKCGVAVSSLADMEILFEGINLEEVTTSMTINSPANAIWAMYLAAAKKKGYDWNKLGGTIQNDILKEFIAQKEFIFPPEPSTKLVIDTFEWGPRNVPKWNFISVSGYHIREAGSTAVQELAYTLADGFEYVEWALKRGLEIDEFAPRISFFFNAHNDFFEEICKFRAARRIWAKEMRHRYGAKNPQSWMLRTHAQTAGVSLTAQQPLINIARVAIQALAAVLGGTNSLHTDAYDEALALPTEESAKIALRTQQIIAYESGVTHTADPLGGSYYVEWLTDQMEAQAMQIIEEIRRMGGVVRAIEEGYFLREIADASYRFQQEVERGERIIVGVNAFQDEGLQVPIQLIDPEVERVQAERLAQVRRQRDPQAVQQALAALRQAAKEGRNTMPYFVDCALAYCTLGEMMDELRAVYGVYEEPVLV